MADLIIPPILSDKDTKNVSTAQATGTFISALKAVGKDKIATPTVQALEALSNGLQVLQNVLRKPITVSLSAGSGSSSGAWTQYTPTFTGSGGSPVFSVNTFKAAYVQNGKTVNLRIVANITVTSAPGNQIVITLPVPALATVGNDQLLGGHSNQFAANPCSGLILVSDPTHLLFVSTGVATVFGIGTYSIFAQGVYEAA